MNETTEDAEIHWHNSFDKSSQRFYSSNTIGTELVTDVSYGEKYGLMFWRT